MRQSARRCGSGLAGFFGFMAQPGDNEKLPVLNISVIPAAAGIQFVGLNALKSNLINHQDSGYRRNDGWGRAGKTHRL
jgi:hypothetical protein